MLPGLGPGTVRTVAQLGYSSLPNPPFEDIKAAFINQAVPQQIDKGNVVYFHNGVLFRDLVRTANSFGTNSWRVAGWLVPPHWVCL